MTTAPGPITSLRVSLDMEPPAPPMASGQSLMIEPAYAVPLRSPLAEIRPMAAKAVVAVPLAPVLKDVPSARAASLPVREAVASPALTQRHRPRVKEAFRDLALATTQDLANPAGKDSTTGAALADPASTVSVSPGAAAALSLHPMEEGPAADLIQPAAPASLPIEPGALPAGAPVAQVAPALVPPAPAALPPLASAPPPAIQPSTFRLRPAAAKPQPPAIRAPSASPTARLAKAAPPRATPPLSAGRRSISPKYRSTARGLEFDITASVNGAGSETVSLLIDSNDAISVRLGAVLGLVRPLMDSTLYARLSSAQAAGDYVSFADLRAAGIDVRYDAAQNRLKLGER